MSECRRPPETKASSRLWIDTLLAAHTNEIEAREIVVRVEFDPGFQIGQADSLDAAMRKLLRFAFSTIPDRCELFVASTRTIASVSSLESGSLTLRWQAAGAELHRRQGSVAAIRPIVGDARIHVESPAARALMGAFHEADWDIELRVMSEDREIWAHAETRHPKAPADRR